MTLKEFNEENEWRWHDAYVANTVGPVEDYLVHITEARLLGLIGPERYHIAVRWVNFRRMQLSL